MTYMGTTPETAQDGGMDASEGQKRGRKPRLMVAGEFSAGKTKLINGLLGERILPSNVTATALPPVWLIAGERFCMTVGLDGQTREVASLDSVTVDDTRYCILSHPAPILEACDIIDTPGTSDPNIPTQSWEWMLDHADAVIWCTNATQAWRQSEKSVWNEMPDRLLFDATLLMTHADRLPDERAGDRVLRRVRRDAEFYFKHFLMASLLDEGDIATIRAHLETLTQGFGPLEQTSEQIADVFEVFRRAAARTPVIPRRVIPRRVSAGTIAPRVETIIEQAPPGVPPDAAQSQTPAHHEVTEPQIVARHPEEDAAQTASDPEQSLLAALIGLQWDEPEAEQEEADEPTVATEEAAEPEAEQEEADEPTVATEEDAEPEAEQEEAIKPTGATEDDLGPEADPEFDTSIADNVHLLVSLASEEEAPAVSPPPDVVQPATARSIWEDLVRGVDLADADMVLSCVEELIVTLDGQQNAPAIGAPRRDDTHQDVAHALVQHVVNRRKP